MHIGRVRLVDGSNMHSGRVEIYTNSTGGVDNSQWGAICGENWDIQDARVVCHQLGYPNAVAVPHYGQGAGPFWLNSVQCLGNESDLFSCMHSEIGYYNCKHDEDASAECLGVPAL